MAIAHQLLDRHPRLGGVAPPVHHQHVVAAPAQPAPRSTGRGTTCPRPPPPASPQRGSRRPSPHPDEQPLLGCPLPRVPIKDAWASGTVRFSERAFAAGDLVSTGAAQCRTVVFMHVARDGDQALLENVGSASSTPKE